MAERADVCLVKLDPVIGAERPIGRGHHSSPAAAPSLFPRNNSKKKLQILVFIIYTTISHVCITAIINPPWGSSLHTPHPPFLLLWQTFKMLTTDDVVDDVSHSHTHTHTQRVSCVGVWRYAPLWVVIATHTHSACVHVKTWCSMKEEEWNQLTVTPLYLLLITSLCSDLVSPPLEALSDKWHEQHHLWTLVRIYYCSSSVTAQSQLSVTVSKPLYSLYN